MLILVPFLTQHPTELYANLKPASVPTVQYEEEAAARAFYTVNLEERASDLEERLAFAERKADVLQMKSLQRLHAETKKDLKTLRNASMDDWKRVRSEIERRRLRGAAHVLAE
jgi:hypothetical protein